MKSLSLIVAATFLIGVTCALSAEQPRRKKGESRPSKKSDEGLRKKREQMTPIPWKELVGKIITVVGRGENWKEGAFLHSDEFKIRVEIRGDHWPTKVYNRTSQNPDAVPRKVKVSGKLEKRRNVPVFTPNSGRAGVGTNPEEVSKRYVLVDVKWEIVPEETDLTTREDLVKLAKKLEKSGMK